MNISNITWIKQVIVTPGVNDGARCLISAVATIYGENWTFPAYLDEHQSEDSAQHHILHEIYFRARTSQLKAEDIAHELETCKLRAKA